MKIEILEYIPDQKGIREGYVDFLVIHSHEKTETFRQIGYFIKDGRKWLGMPNVERNGNWKPRYERTPSLKNLFIDALKALEEYLN